ncbi:MAG: alpha-galactosidase [Nitrososphaerota archaeon]|nr:alpha-galactosidase [Nitrososphaerota archaeon]
MPTRRLSPRPYAERKGRVWSLNSEGMSYVMGLSDSGQLANIYWGSRIDDETDFARPAGMRYPFELQSKMLREEYPAWGGPNYREACLKVRYNDRVRDCDLAFLEVSCGKSRSDVVAELGDEAYGLKVRLHYKLYDGYDLLAKHAEVLNVGRHPMRIESVLSAAWYLPSGRDWRLTHLAGAWGREMRLERDILTPGKKVIESRKGTTSHQANPVFFVDRGDADEAKGGVWFGCLAWSGSWKIVAEQDTYQQLRLVGGVNDFDFSYLLRPGECFRTPPFIAGYSSRGFGEASRKLHRFEVGNLLPRRFASSVRPVIFNTWEATVFDVDERRALQLARLSSRLGAECFVVDDGWFKGRKDSTGGLGDWVPDPEKFPHGLTPLVKSVNSMGMKFGIWVEPEMVNPKSQLYQAHPDWVYHFPNRKRTEMRSQLVLNLCDAEVADYVLKSMDELIGDNNIEYVKWDMNRYFSEPGWQRAPRGREQEVWVRHVDALYEILDRLRSRHPGVLFEGCSGGGGRIDLGALQRFDHFAGSDNTDPTEVLFTHEGFTMAYAPKTMLLCVGGSTNGLTGREVSLGYRFDFAMMGTLSMSLDIRGWNKEEFELAKRKVQFYKSIRKVVQNGDLYRLAPPSLDGICVREFVSRDSTEAVLFAFSHVLSKASAKTTVRLEGLRHSLRYGIEPGKVSLGGGYLMRHGVDINLGGDNDSVVYRLKGN